MLTDWKRNVLVYKIDSVLDWFYVPIGVWVLVWTKFFDFTKISLAMGIGLFWSTILDLPAGALADMIGRKKTVMLGRLILFLGYIFLFFRHDFWGLIIWQMCYQTDGAFTSGANSALIYDSLKENDEVEKNYKKTEADSYMFNTIGMALAAIVGGFLFKINTMAPYTFMIPISGLALLASSFYEEPAIKRAKLNLNNYFTQNFNGVKHVFSNPHIRAVAFFTIAINLVAYSGIWYLYEPRLAMGDFDARIFAVLVSGGYLVRALGTKLIPVVDKKIKKSGGPLFLAIFQTFGSVLSFIGGRFGAIAGVYSGKMSDGFRQPTMVALQNDQISSEYRATSLSTLSLMSNILLSLLGIWIGVGIDKLGARITMGFYAVFGILVVIPLGLHLTNIMKGSESKN